MASRGGATAANRYDAREELCAAVLDNPAAYAANADQFAGLPPICVRRVLEGLENAACNGREFAWGNVLKLIGSTYSKFHLFIHSSTIAASDDLSWTWACTTASQLLMAGLRRGVEGISFDHAASVRSLVFTLVDLAPKEAESENFEEQYRREPFLAAQSTLRGLAVESCILLTFWLSKDASSPIAAAPRETLSHLPDVRLALEADLSDRSAAGRIPRAIMGRYLNWLFYVREWWLRAQLSAMFPQNDKSLRRAAWLAHLGFDKGPNKDLLPELRPCYEDEIARLSGDDAPDHDFRRDRLAEHLVILHLWGALPGDLLERFWQIAPSSLRQHAMWYLGTQLELDLPGEMRPRGFAYGDSGCTLRRIRPIPMHIAPNSVRLGNGASTTKLIRLGFPTNCSPC